MILCMNNVSKRKIDSIRDRRLRAVVRYAYEKVPYYRELFDTHGLSPSQIRGVDDLQRIPITTRDDLQSTPLERLVSKDVRIDRMVKVKTSGSSGKPLTILTTRVENALEKIIFGKVRRYFGRRIWYRSAFVGVIREKDHFKSTLPYMPCHLHNSCPARRLYNP